MGIRNAARAIIVDQRKMLVNKNQNSIGDMCYGIPNGAIYYDLPGGGQNQYETLEETVKRECLEESGYTVAVDRLAAIYEEISMNDAFRREYEQHAHRIHFLFICHVTRGPIKPLAEKDLDMLESVWVDIEEIKDIPLYPQTIKDNLARILGTDSVLYLGSDRVL